jgi:general stress protein 26
MTDLDRVWAMVESIRFCMLATWDGTKLHSRPMGVFPRRDDNALYFFTDARAHKDGENCRHPHVCLAFADTHRQNYVSLSGTAAISADHAKIKELWALPARLWWKSPDNPDVRLIKVTPAYAEYWDAPGNLVSNIKVAFGLLTHRHVDYGEHKRVTM